MGCSADADGQPTGLPAPAGHPPALGGAAGRPRELSPPCGSAHAQPAAGGSGLRAAGGIVTIVVNPTTSLPCGLPPSPARPSSARMSLRLPCTPHTCWALPPPRADRLDAEWRGVIALWERYRHSFKNWSNRFQVQSMRLHRRLHSITNAGQQGFPHIR